jgi:hypothetical protein
MFSIEASDSERLIKLTWLGHVDSDEMRRCAEEIGLRTANIPPGFRVLVDMTELESMDYAGSPFIGSIMDLCLAKQVEHVVRVIPNPRKDIGLSIMSYLRYGSKVRVTICDNLDDAMRRLAEWVPFVSGCRKTLENQLFLVESPPSLSQRRETYERIARGRDFIDNYNRFRYAGTETKERTPW